MAIASAIQKPGNWINLYDSSNKLLCQLTGELQSYTSTTVTVKRGTCIYVYDEKGKQISVRGC